MEWLLFIAACRALLIIGCRTVGTTNTLHFTWCSIQFDYTIIVLYLTIFMLFYFLPAMYKGSLDDMW